MDTPMRAPQKPRTSIELKNLMKHKIEMMEEYEEEKYEERNHTSEWCNKYNDKALPDEKNNCSLCGKSL